jgi:hypothetical protein
MKSILKKHGVVISSLMDELTDREVDVVIEQLIDMTNKVKNGTPLYPYMVFERGSMFVLSTKKLTQGSLKEIGDAMGLNDGYDEGEE